MKLALYQQVLHKDHIWNVSETCQCVINFLFLDDVPSDKPKKKGKSENPFSFKKFLSSSGTKPAEGRTKEKPKSKDYLPDVSTELGSDLGSDSVDISVDTLPVLAGDLPDFVQDHYTDSSNVITDSPLQTDFHLANTTDLSLPDFTDHSGNKSHNNESPREHTTLPIPSEDSNNSDEDRLGFDSQDESENEDELHADKTDSSSVGVMLDNLPDFLSDGAIGSSRTKHRHLMVDSEHTDPVHDPSTSNEDIAALKVSH